MNTIFERIKELIANLIEVDKDTITRETTICDPRLDFAYLIYSIEMEFDIEIPDSDAEKFVTVGDVVMYVQNNS